MIKFKSYFSRLKSMVYLDFGHFGADFEERKEKCPQMLRSDHRELVKG